MPFCLFQTGDRVGIMRKSDDTLHFYLNGSDVGKCFGRADKTLYAVVDIYGHAEEVTITGMKFIRDRKIALQ